MWVQGGNNAGWMGPGAVPEFLTPGSEVPLEHFQIAQNLFPLIYKLPQGWKVCSLFRKLLNNRNEWAQWMFSCCSFLKSINFYDLYWRLQPSLFYDLMVFYPNLFYSSVVFKVSSNPSRFMILCYTNCLSALPLQYLHILYRLTASFLICVWRAASSPYYVMWVMFPQN